MAKSPGTLLHICTIISLLALTITKPGVVFCQQQQSQIDVPSKLFFNTPQTTSSLQNQDIYRSTMYLTGFYSQYTDQRSGTQYNLGFTNSTPGLYTLAILMNVDPSITGADSADPNRVGARVIWEANRHDPVRFNASLTVEDDGDFVLRDGDGRFVWNTGTGNKGVTAIRVLDTGNLVVLSNETIVWQSFDHPSDSLMAGQVLRPGAVLRSRKSRQDPTLGDHMLVMEPGGLVLYSRPNSSSGGGTQEPYWVRSYSGVDTLDAAQRSCGSRLVSAVLDGNGLSLNLNMQLSNISSNSSIPSSSSCTFNETNSLTIRGSNVVQNISFIRLEHDGNLRVYTLESMQLWETPYPVINESIDCSLPQKCGAFGLCSLGSCNACLNSDGSNSAWTSECSSPRVESCTDVNSLHFLRVPGSEHFSSRYTNSSASAMSFEDCRSRCLTNCSCSAFYFWEESSSCFIPPGDQIGTLVSVPNQNHVAYIKATRIPESSSSSLSTGAVAGVAVGSVVLLVMIISIAAFCIIKSRIPIQAVDYDSDNFLESIENLRPIRFTHGDLERITDNFSLVLGTGGFGGVYEGTLPDGRKVAVKKLESSGQGKKEFYAEVAVLGTLHHWNLVKLLGFCSEGSHRLLVYEHMSNGSLDKWIFSDDEKKLLSWQQRMEIMLGMARGLAYLHEECMQRIIHLDIKPQNILLDEDFVAKVADFGLARLMSRDESFVMTTMRGTPGYLAPEWLLEAAITEKSDVYSFGVVVLEVISGRKNFTRVTGTGEDQKFYLPAHALELVKQGREVELLDPKLRNGVDAGGLPEEIVAGVKKCVRVAFECLQEDSSTRPSMGNVVQMLEGSLNVKQVQSEGLFFSTRASQTPQLLSGSTVGSSSSSTGGNVFSFPASLAR